MRKEQYKPKHDAKVKVIAQPLPYEAPRLEFIGGLADFTKNIFGKNGMLSPLVGNS